MFSKLKETVNGLFAMDVSAKASVTVCTRRTKAILGRSGEA